MNIKSMFNNNKTVFSFEIFPPKKSSSINTIYDTLDKLKGLHPNFISVTYGAGGTSSNLSCEIASKIQNELKIETLAHLTCVNSTKEEVHKVLKEFKAHGIENILALRGDIIPDVPRKNDFKYASELIEFIKSDSDCNFNLSGACYPEVHPESKDLYEDLEHLKRKVDAGAEHLISQLFFDNSTFYQFIDKSVQHGIKVPIEAGIMPVTNKKQIERMVSLCGASLPIKFVKIMQKYESSPEALRDAGIAYAVEQIVDLIANEVDGIHLYTMNNAYVARKITESIENLL